MRKEITGIAAALLTSVFAAGGDTPSFDTGMDVEFNAEDNENIAYETNPACVTYFETHTILTDFGGDMSFGRFEFSANDGSTEPGSSIGGGEALSVSYTLGTCVKGMSAFRLGESFVLGVGGGYDYNCVKLGYNGPGIPYAPYYLAYTGLHGLEVKSTAFSGTGIVAIEFGKISVGSSFGYYDSKDDFKYSYEYGYCREEPHGVRGLVNMEARVGIQYRSDGLKIGFSPGYAKLKNEIEWDLFSEDFGYPRPDSKSHEGISDIGGNGILAEADAKFRVSDNFGLGFGFSGRIVPKVTADYETLDYENGIPTASGGRDLGEGKEQVYKAKTGFAFYPDDKTTLAFDYNAAFYNADFDLWNEYGYTTDTYELSSRTTYTQLGAERWITDDLEAKLGWRQNIHTLPRNVLFAGIHYNVTDTIGFAYDYMGEYVGISNFSLFTPLSELVHPGSHKMSLSIGL